MTAQQHTVGETKIYLGKPPSAGEAASLPEYRVGAEEVLRRLGSDAQNGLTADEAARRLREYGPNRLASAPGVPWWRRLIAQFQNLLVAILLAATVVSGAEWALQSPRETPLPYETIVILLIVLLNALLGFVQESRADRAVHALLSLTAPMATVVRGGERLRLPAGDLVPGDLILLEAGDTVPADARLIESAGLKAAESALTGESVPVTKSTAVLPDEAPLADRRCMVFSGTATTLGRGRAIVTATGAQTEVGHISHLVHTAVKEPTPLEKELDRVGRRITVGVLVICAIVFAAGLLTGQASGGLRGILHLSLLAVAIAVAAIPEALQTIVTMGLAVGTRRMAARNAIIRRLPAVETLGAATVICTDKTGTLTRNEMTVRVVLTADAQVEVGGSGYEPAGALTVDEKPLAGMPHAVRYGVAKTLRTGALANDATLTQDAAGRWSVLGDATEGALLTAARKMDAHPLGTERFAREAEIPFSSERKRHVTVHSDAQEADKWRVFVKGAPDVLLPRCAFVLEGGEARPLSEERREAFLEKNAALADRALRTLAMAEKKVERGADGQPEVGPQMEEELVLLGIVGIMDPPRPEAAEAVATARRAGIRVLMATGDHRRTAVAIAREIGILDAGGVVLTGPEVAAMDDAALDAVIEKTQVFARVDPEHKLRIIDSGQRRGGVVAMTGDGVNDAPALRAADIGVAMGVTGTDVSREAADMVLADDNFATIVRAVEEGRGIFENIRRYLYFLLGCNMGEVATMFLGILLGAAVLGLVPASGVGFFLPLSAAQILWMNLVTDGLPALALGMEPTSPDVMNRPPRDLSRGILTARSWLRIGGTGLLMALGTLFVLDAAYPGGLFDFAVRFSELAQAERYARSLAFTTLVLFQLVNAVNYRGAPGRSPLWQMGRSPLLWGALAVSLLLQAAVLYVPFLQNAFGTVPLSLRDWGLSFAVASSALILSEAVRIGGQSRGAF